MYFHSPQFIVFLGLAFALYWGVAQWRWPRMLVLLVVSGAFYASFSPWMLLTVAWYALLNWGASKLFARTEVSWKRRTVMIAVVAHHLGILCTFKYGDLFRITAVGALRLVGLDVPDPEPLGLLLPVGLSFITFAAIASVVETWKGNSGTQYSYPEHLLGLLFFPVVVSGPILRPEHLLQKLNEVPTLSPEDGGRGMFRIARGIAKKLLIADVLAAGIVDRVYAHPADFTSAETALATVAYTLQLYFDFSGYTDIAIGSAQLFGFKLPENFNKPYHAKNLFEFWNRWHQTLSNWLRDYLYRPMGGSRVSRPRVLFNLMTVMFLGGLWHGSDWRFAAWGFIHGLFLCGLRAWWWWRGKPKAYTLAGTVMGITVTFTLVVLSRIVFRADDLGRALEVVQQMLLFTPGLANVQTVVWVALIGAVVTYVMPIRWADGVQELFVKMPAPVRAVSLVGLGLLMRQIATFEVQPYIYFQF